MRALATMVLATLIGVGASGALTPPLMHCHSDSLDPAERDLGDYNVFTYQGGFVSYERFLADNEVEFVLEHCESRNRMTAVFDLSGGWLPFDQYRSRLDEAFASPAVYTLRNLAQMAREGGALQAGLGSVLFQSCGCQWAAAWRRL